MRNKDKKYHYLYKTTNLINNKYYYGIHSTNNLKDNYLGSGKRLRYSIRKYGKENFKREILYYFDNREELSKAEENILTENLLKDKMCMNIVPGGEKFNTSGMVTVRDKDNNCFCVFLDDERYLSGELVGVTKDLFNVKDNDGNILKVSVNDLRYLSGELVHITKKHIPVKDEDGNTFQVSVNDLRYLSGELVHVTKETICVKDKHGNSFRVSKDDPRYLSGDLCGIFKGKTHNKETKKKIGKANSIKQKGKNNSQYGSCWIMKEGQNKKIKKEELQSYINNGWIKGRKIK